MNDLQKRRHSIAHLLGCAVCKLYPEAKLVFGPATDDGFFYDIELEEKISEVAIEKIEMKMKEILPMLDKFEESEIDYKKGREIYSDNKYKLSVIEEAEKERSVLRVVKSGDFTDLCAGGHIDSMKKVTPGSFKISRISAAHWKDEDFPSLTRIYGFAFENDKELAEFLSTREMAKQNDHRKLGKAMELFSFSELVGPGLPLFSPKGTAMRDAITSKLDILLKKFGYKKVWIPHIAKNQLYKTSGHWEKFGDELLKVRGKHEDYVLKPMNCPHHTQIYASVPRSYKDLPIRYAEHTTVYRDEQSGELLGLSRVLSLTQDDGHIFCTRDQIKDEVKNTVQLISEFYTILGMFSDGKYKISLSIRDSKNIDTYIGDADVWDKAEQSLEEVLKEEKLEYQKIEGEAAFYGPKIDFLFKDSLGREWQLSTIQLDFNLPNRFNLKYTDKNGKEDVPIMIHRAIAGSIERFLSVMIEHFGGKFPYWLAPVQVLILPVSKAQNNYAEVIKALMDKKNIRVEIDYTNKSIGKKLYEAKKEAPPYIAIIGSRDVKSHRITLQERNGKELKMKVNTAINRLVEENLVLKEERSDRASSGILSRLFGKIF